MTKTKTFTDVAGQTITVKRPPDDYLVIANTDGHSMFIARALFAESTDQRAREFLLAALDRGSFNQEGVSDREHAPGGE